MMKKRKPTSMKRRGKFPEWVRQLSERELIDLVYASLRDWPIEKAKRIVSGGQTIWLSGHRTDNDIGYSDDGRHLIPVIVYRN